MRLQVGEARLGLAAGRHDRAATAGAPEPTTVTGFAPTRAATSSGASSRGWPTGPARRRRAGHRPCRGGHRPPRPAAFSSRGPSSSSARCAMTARLVAPTTGTPDASARPRAAATPPRTPVKVPGPTVTAMRARSQKARPASSIDLGDHRHQPLGMAALAQLEAVARQPFAARALPAHGHRHRAEAGIERQYIHAFAPHQGVELRLSAQSRRKQSADCAGAAPPDRRIPHCTESSI